ncbi:hypothetical protein CROQUDRAFT_110921 [Cronartium quercuum f. sp. fusiforme G11]|uniref:RNase H type-1 domain-containing protein n=1 Tax=Cronartium quercuum f. sp. fusiforme G11 TaxID=708437 RepID=A0A9P6T7T4_9BASI|nr:hypothetical protein CROQUDRAFT_110921 [Cronartium quercuum f. sp. fusiforme G11]
MSHSILLEKGRLLVFPSVGSHRTESIIDGAACEFNNFGVSKGLNAFYVEIALRWCSGHKGLPRNERVDQLAAKAAATRNLPQIHTHKPSQSSRLPRCTQGLDEDHSPARFSHQDIKRLCHDPQPCKIFKSLIDFPNSHSIASVTQLRNGHIPLFDYLHSRHLQPSPEHPRSKLKGEVKKLNLPFNKSILHEPQTFYVVADFISDRWRLKSRWEWAEINHEGIPEGKPNQP